METDCLSISLRRVDNDVDRRAEIVPGLREDANVEALLDGPVVNIEPAIAPLLVGVSCRRRCHHLDVAGIQVH
jgi:hypothetical protein